MNRILRGSAAYVAASIVQRAAIFLMLPFVTRAMTPAEFGKVGIAIALSQLFNLLLSFGIDAAVVREWHRNADDERAHRALLQSASGLLMVAAPAGALLTLLAAYASGWAYLGASAWLVLVLASTAFALLSALPLAALRAQERLRDYLFLTGVQALVVVAGTAVGVLILRGGAVGWMAGTAAGNVIALCVAVRLLPWPRPRLSDAASRDAILRLSLPLVPHLAAVWGLQLSDRVLGAAVLSPADVGALSLAINIVVPLAVIATAVAQATQPSFARAQRPDSDPAQLSPVILSQAALIVGFTLAICAAGPLAVESLFTEQFAAAGNVVPIVAVGTAIWALYAIPMNGLSLIAGRTGKVWLVTSACLVVKAVLVLDVIPDDDIAAVAWVFILSNGILFSGALVLALRDSRSRPTLLAANVLGTCGTALIAMGVALAVSSLVDTRLAQAGGCLAVLGAYAAATYLATRRIASVPRSA